MLEVGTPNLFFQFPDELDVDGYPLLHGIACAEQRRQRRTFVVRRTPADVLVAFFVKNERRPPPLGLIGRLDVEMVVDRHHRPILTRNKPPDNDGITRRVHFLGVRAQRAQILNRGIRPTVDIGFVVRLGADGRNFDPLLKLCFEFGPG